jgi:hypothetical protein
MQFLSVNVDPRYLNFATFSKDLLATLIYLLCPAVHLHLYNLYGDDTCYVLLSVSFSNVSQFHIFCTEFRGLFEEWMKPVCFVNDDKKTCFKSYCCLVWRFLACDNGPRAKFPAQTKLSGYHKIIRWYFQLKDFNNVNWFKLAQDRFGNGSLYQRLWTSRVPIPNLLLLLLILTD